MDSINLKPVNNVLGEVNIPSSKSLSHRAIICAALSEGESIIKNITFSRDIYATISILKNLGISIAVFENSVKIISNGKIRLTDSTLFSDESGSTLRFLIPVALLQEEKVIFTGAGKLIERPLNPYYKIFHEQNINYNNDNGKLPLTVQGKIKSGNFQIPGDISSQFISGLMFALPLLPNDSTINIEGQLESKAYIDLTMDCLNKFGIKVINNNYRSFYIKGNQKYVPMEYNVEGDFSQAAFFMVAGTISGEVECKNLNMESLQGDKKIVELLKSMGAIIEEKNSSIICRKSKLSGINIDASEIPDLVPVLAVAASLSHGRTNIYNAARLRIKECDRLAATCRELSRLGAEIIEKDDSLIINGKETLLGGAVDSWNDHRIVMAMSIAALRCKDSVKISNYKAVNKSYPNFFEDYKSIGGNIFI
ncbi:3-phosphoshikimate 1-carboxyvinyltransferase [Clostridium sp. 19966]|uniref:3-phosphoshikimate 1-carboxyvinyltransferase n=1 Tax=Clostridium sp. 19966 TaxID=2768166 RepID=UPI0028E03B9F|nr:3-phosphoshikimate 1-carboxyvinyltransferase [Clostridium sp. 19966]MDT8716372.1 3-phosphoshikimate 1-carboxyvinyltransferase [Clostridium sp. 19966]